MIRKLTTIDEWTELNRAGDILTPKIILAIDDEEPIKKEIINIFQKHRSDIDICDMVPGVFDTMVSNGRLCPDHPTFRSPGCVFYNDGKAVWVNSLNFLELDDHAWNNMILHNMFKKFFGEKPE